MSTEKTCAALYASVIDAINKREFALARSLMQEAYDFCRAHPQLDLLRELFGGVISDFGKGQFDRARTRVLSLQQPDTPPPTQPPTSTRLQ